MPGASGTTGLDYIGNYTREPNQRTRVYGVDGVAPTLVANDSGGGREPKVLVMWDGTISLEEVDE